MVINPNDFKKQETAEYDEILGDPIKKELNELKQWILHPEKAYETSLGKTSASAEKKEKSAFDTTPQDIVQISDGDIPLEDAQILIEKCREGNLNPLGVLAIMYKESTFQKKIAGDLKLGYAYGYFQFNLTTSKDILASYSPPIKTQADLKWICRNMEGQMDLFLHFIQHRWKRPMLSALQKEIPDWEVIATYHNGANYEPGYINGKKGIKTNFYRFKNTYSQHKTQSIAQIQATIEKENKREFKTEKIYRNPTTEHTVQKSEALENIIDIVNQKASKDIWGKSGWQDGKSLLNKNTENRKLFAYKIENQIGYLHPGDIVSMGQNSDKSVWFKIIRNKKVSWITIAQKSLSEQNSDDMLYFKVNQQTPKPYKNAVQEIKDELKKTLLQKFGDYDLKESDQLTITKDRHGIVATFKRGGNNPLYIRPNGKKNETFQNKKTERVSSGEIPKQYLQPYTVPKGVTLEKIAQRISAQFGDYKDILKLLKKLNGKERVVANEDIIILAQKVPAPTSRIPKVIKDFVETYYDIDSEDSNKWSFYNAEDTIRALNGLRTIEKGKIKRKGLHEAPEKELLVPIPRNILRKYI